MRLKSYPLALLILIPSDVRAQQAASICMEQAQRATLAEHPRPVQQAAKSLPARENHPRLFWIMPTFTVSNSSSPISLTSGEKSRLYLRNTADPFTVTCTAFGAGIQQPNNGLSGYGQGAAGYGKRLAAGLADEKSVGFFRAYLFPSVFHQDPRYFRKGSGPLKERLMNAISRPIVTRKDSGGRTFDWSGLLGVTASSSLSNVYYSAADRGIERTFKRVATGIPFKMIDP